MLGGGGFRLVGVSFRVDPFIVVKENGVRSLLCSGAEACRYQLWLSGIVGFYQVGSASETWWRKTAETPKLRLKQLWGDKRL